MGDNLEAQKLFEIGKALYQQGKYHAAADTFEKTIYKDSTYVDAYNYLGLALSHIGKVEEAIKMLNKAIEIDPKCVEGYTNLGNILFESEKYPDALAFYEKAANADPNYANAFFNWGYTLDYLKNFEDAVAKYEQAIHAKHDYHPYAYHNIAEIYWKQGRYKESLTAWHKAREVYYHVKEKKSPRDYFNKAKDFQYLGDILREFLCELDQAQKIYLEGLQVEPDNINILYGLVSLYLDQKDCMLFKNEVATTNYWKAWEMYKKCEKLLDDQIESLGETTDDRLRQKEKALLYLQLGKLYILMKEYDKAEKIMLKALDLEKESAEIYTNLGIVYIRKDKHQKAVDYFEAALRQDIDNLTIRSNLAESYFKNGKLERAEEEHLKILDITLYHVESHIGLGHIYTAKGEAGDEDMFAHAIYHFTEGLKISKAETGSKKFNKKELADVYYSRGYARVKLFELSKTTRDETELTKAFNDFKLCYKIDSENHKAKRVIEKIKKRAVRLAPQWLTETLGPTLIILCSVCVFLFSQLSFYGVNVSLGQYVYWKSNTMIMKDVYSYVILTFGSVFLMIAGMSLPQILKLKVAGIELEKSSVDQVKRSESMCAGM